LRDVGTLLADVVVKSWISK